MEFGRQEENAYGTDAFDPRWDDQGKGKIGKGSRGSEPRIADPARLFFMELSTMQNAIYNNPVSLARVCILLG